MLRGKTGALLLSWNVGEGVVRLREGEAARPGLPIQSSRALEKDHILSKRNNIVDVRI